MTDYTPEAIEADVAKVREWYAETPCPVIDRLLSLAERVAKSPTRRADEALAIGMGSLDWSYEGRMCALVLLEPAREYPPEDAP